MIWKILTGTFLFSLLIAIVLYLAGVRYVGLDNNFMKLFMFMNQRINTYSISIPSIPSIPIASGGFELVSAVINFINGIIAFVNFLIYVVNMLINLINLVFAFGSSIIGYLAGFGATI